MQNIRARIREINQLLAKLENNHVPQNNTPTVWNEKLPVGLSVIVPLYQAAPYIERLVKSVNRAVGEYPYEILFVLNGETDDIETDQQLIRQAVPSFNYQILLSDKGAAAARNVGIKQARYEHCLFLDADDELSENLFDRLAPHLTPSNLTLYEIHNVMEKSDNGENVIQRELNLFMGKTTHRYDGLTKALSMNGAKVIPTLYLKNTMYNESLQSGEDVVLMMTIIAQFAPPITVVPKGTGIYYRHLTKNSLSRTTETYDFNVLQRFEVIKALGNVLDYTDDAESRRIITNRMDAQAGFVNRYLKKHKEDYLRTIELFETLTSEYIPYSAINRDLSETLYIGYCFTPYTDTSGIVLAKRIREHHVPCDVISNNMSDVREIDYTLSSIAAPYIHRHFELDTKSSFSSWPLIENFITKGERRVKDTEYKTIYSRVLWPGSHFLAFKLKMDRPHTKWIAEFSDPVLSDIKSNKRHSLIQSRSMYKKFKALDSCWRPYIDRNLFNMTEIIAFAAADELVFTNTNQLEVMIERFTPDLQELIREKSVIAAHPVMPERFYHRDKALIPLDDHHYHIGYFGNFYETRGLEEIVRLINEPIVDEPVKVHIFTSWPKQAKIELIKAGVGDKVEVYPYLRYFEFLNMTTQLDALLVMDAHTKAYKKVNPYLPSKLSDYLGSGKPIIAFTEAGSIMAQLDRADMIQIPLQRENSS